MEGRVSCLMTVELVKMDQEVPDLLQSATHGLKWVVEACCNESVA